MKGKRILAGITALVLCLAISFAAIGEVKEKTTEENGKIKETVWEDENGQPAAGPDGYYAVRYTYRQDGTIEKYFDAEGKPFRVNGGYYGRRVQKDGRGNITEIEYLDENGDRTLNRQGYGKITMNYFGFGALRNVRYYGLNKKLITVPSLGYAHIEYEYSNKTMTSRTYLDANDKPVDPDKGVASVRQKVDKRFQVLSIRYDHANGKRATGSDGWFRCEKKRDDKGRLISVKYFDEDEKMIDRGEAYSWEGYSYEGDNNVKVTRYDLNGQPVADNAGIVTIVREIKDGRIVKESYLDLEGKRVNNSDGVGAVLYSYDLQGAIEKVTYQDIEGNIARCNGGYAGYRDTKDEDGATASRTYLGTDGTPAETNGGYSEVRYSYDETKVLTTKRYYDLSGKQVKAE